MLTLSLLYYICYLYICYLCEKLKKNTWIQTIWEMVAERYFIFLRWNALYECVGFRSTSIKVMCVLL